jgi:hypothetical protein
MKELAPPVARAFPRLLKPQESKTQVVAASAFDQEQSQCCCSTREKFSSIVPLIVGPVLLLAALVTAFVEPILAILMVIGTVVIEAGLFCADCMSPAEEKQPIVEQPQRPKPKPSELFKTPTDFRNPAIVSLEFKRERIKKGIEWLQKEEKAHQQNLAEHPAEPTQATEIELRYVDDLVKKKEARLREVEKQIADFGKK